MKAVLFDFNGTLYNDTNYHRRAWHDYMLERFGREYGVEEIDRWFIGPANRAILEHCFPGISDADADRYSREKEAVYRGIASETEESRRLVDGVPEMLDCLAARGIPFAMATASLLDNVEFYLNGLGLSRWFTMDRIVYDTGAIACKPAPDFYIEAARRLGCVPRDCVVVEDSPTGIESARRAGAGRIIAIDCTQPRAALEKRPELYAVIHDFRNFDQYL